jgi:NADPH2:quinone reductase
MEVVVFVMQVIGVAGGDTKCALVKAKGAMAAIDYGTEPDFKFKVMQMTDRRGADVIVDMVGGKTTEECVRWSVT